MKKTALDFIQRQIQKELLERKYSSFHMFKHLNEDLHLIVSLKDVNRIYKRLHRHIAKTKYTIPNEAEHTAQAYAPIESDKEFVEETEKRVNWTFDTESKKTKRFEPGPSWIVKNKNKPNEKIIFINPPEYDKSPESEMDLLLSEFEVAVDVSTKLDLFKKIMKVFDDAEKIYRTDKEHKKYLARMKELRKEWYRLWKQFYLENGGKND